MDYQPVVTSTNGNLKVTALVGANTAIFGLDLLGGPGQRAGLLGFAISRTNLKDGQAEWLKNPIKFKRTPHQDRFNIAGTPSNLAPIQQFRWADHRMDNAPGVAYRYTISALYGDPADPQPTAPPVVIELVPAPTDSPELPLSLRFNRGVVATPAYRQQFDNRRPGANGSADVEAAQRYLSRGLWEALLGFIAQAQPGDELDVAIYELHHESVVAELQRAVDRGVRLRLLYHAKRGTDAERSVRLTREMVGRLRPAPGGAAPLCRPRRNVRGLSHNKFVVLRRDGAPVQVWTGSTNFTDAGFFLQTNVGIVLRDPAIARAYAGYFDLLAEDRAPTPVMRAIGGLDLRTALPAIPRLFFSPVAGDELLRVSAGMIREAQQAVLLSCPFGLEADGVILKALRQLDPRVVVYGLMNTNQRGNLTVLDPSSDDAQEFVVPDWIKRLNGEEYDAGTGSGNQVHVKSLVVDPWGPRPRVLIGSANFSGESVNDNDENALLIEGDSWAAAIVATEFLRAFEHYRFRNYLRRIAELVDTQERPQQLAYGGWSGGILSDAETRGAVGPLDEWFLDMDALDQLPADGAPGLATRGAVEYGDYWLSESDGWAATYFERGTARCRERELFAQS
ncbi:MAG: hypothetical protein IPO81_25300 [Kouleothrix sp.]|nr:hypothetical protein [Kouleothrix sp.]